MITVHVNANAAHTALRDYLLQWLPSALELVSKPPTEISFALVGNAKMAALHERFMQIPGPTDVLTFELDHSADGAVTAGEIVLCVPYARREAARRGIDPQHELLLYALHGVLHLSGYDDLDSEGNAKMHAEEDRILQAIGIGAVFHR